MTMHGLSAKIVHYIRIYSIIIVICYHCCHHHYHLHPTINLKKTCKSAWVFLQEWLIRPDGYACTLLIQADVEICNLLVTKLYGFWIFAFSKSLAHIDLIDRYVGLVINWLSLEANELVHFIWGSLEKVWLAVRLQSLRFRINLDTSYYRPYVA